MDKSRSLPDKMDDKQTIISRSVSFKALILARVLPDRGRDSLAYYLSVRVIFTCVWLLVASDAFYIYSRINGKCFSRVSYSTITKFFRQLRF